MQLQPAALVLPLFASAASAQITVEDAFLEDPTGQLDSLFGLALDVEGARLVVGAPGGFGEPPNPVVGRAYVYERTPAGAWVLVDELVSGTSAVGDRFGAGISIDRNRVAVGSSEDTAGPAAGAVHLFEQQASGSWLELQTLYPSTASGEPYFGYELELQDSRLIVSAFGDDTLAPDSGAIYVFEQQPDGTWVEDAVLRDPHPEIDDGFGSEIALDGDRILAGATLASLAGDGRAYLFERDGAGRWGDAMPLVPAETSTLDGYGSAVALEGDLAVVGSVYDDGGGINAGAFCTFEPAGDGTWRQTGIEYPLLPQQVSLFADTLELDDGRLAVGARLQELPGDPYAAGAIFLYERRGSGWRRGAILGVEEPAESLQLGTVFALDGRSLAAFGNYPTEEPGFFVDTRVYDYSAGELF